MNAHSAPKRIVEGVTTRKMAKCIVQQGRKKLLFCVTKQAVITRHIGVGNVKRAEEALARLISMYSDLRY